MSSNRTRRHRKSALALRASAALCTLGALLAGGGVATTAASFNDSVTAAVEADIGIITLDLADAGGAATESLTLDFNDLEPGMEVRKDFRLISNSTLPGRLKIHTTGGGEVADQLGVRFGNIASFVNAPGGAYISGTLGSFTANIVTAAKFDVAAYLIIEVPEDLDSAYQGMSEQVTLVFTLETR